MSLKIDKTRKNIVTRNKDIMAFMKSYPSSCTDCTRAYCCINQLGFGVSKDELNVLARLVTPAIKRRMESMPKTGSYTCPFLNTSTRRCDVYDVRLGVCALYHCITPAEQCNTFVYKQGVNMFNNAIIMSNVKWFSHPKNYKKHETYDLRDALVKRYNLDLMNKPNINLAGRSIFELEITREIIDQVIIDLQKDTPTILLAIVNGVSDAEYIVKGEEATEYKGTATIVMSNGDKWEAKGEADRIDFTLVD